MAVKFIKAGSQQKRRKTLRKLLLAAAATAVALSGWSGSGKAETVQVSCIGKLVNGSHGPHLVKIVDQWKTGVPAWPSRSCNAIIPSRVSTIAESTCVLNKPCQITGRLIKQKNKPGAHWYVIFNMDTLVNS
jgi:hypothetical protein